MTDDEKAVVIKVLCSQALADHLGDVRDAEEQLWQLLDAPKLPYNDPAWDAGSPFRITAARLRAAGYGLPAHLRGEDEEASS